MQNLRRKLFVYGGLLILILAIIAGGFFVTKLHDSKNELPDVEAKVGKLIQLPAGEEPTLATVSDIEKLKGQAFFSNAQNGDKVLIYNKARKAYLYRPTTNMLIDVAAVNLGQEGTSQVAGAETQASQSAATPTVAPTPSSLTVAVYNGTKTPKLASRVEASLKSTVPNATVTVKDNAKSTYEITRVIDLKGTNQASVKQLLALTGGEEGVLPTGEDKPNTDILIILGTDFIKKK